MGVNKGGTTPILALSDFPTVARTNFPAKMRSMFGNNGLKNADASAEQIGSPLVSAFFSQWFPEISWNHWLENADTSTEQIHSPLVSAFFKRCLPEISGNHRFKNAETNGE